jgi:hypothetical protein
MQKKWAIGGLGVVTAIVLFFALRPAKVDVKDPPPTPDAAPVAPVSAPRVRGRRGGLCARRGAAG